jgi:tetratricopeptide (TPR) repeat protein
MILIRSRAFAVACCLSVTAPLWSPAPVQAAEEKDDARRFFKAGQKAFAAGRFEEAARAFEEAFRIAPHPAPLVNAGDSYEKAGELALAARTYQRVLDLAQSGEQDRQDATDRLARLTPKLAVIQLSGDETAVVRIDEDEFRGNQRVYVTPGEHDVTLVDVPGASNKRVDIAAGATRTVTVDSLRPVAAKGDSSDAGADDGSETGDVTADASSKAGGISALTWVSLGVGVVGAGAAVYFGLQVNDAERAYNDQPNQDDFDRFDQNKLLTNVSIGVSALGLGLGTYFLIRDLGKKPQTSATRRIDVSPVPGGAVLLSSGRF